MLTLIANLSFLIVIFIPIRQVYRMHTYKIIDKLNPKDDIDWGTNEGKIIHFAIVVLFNILLLLDGYSLSLKKFIIFCVIVCGELVLLVIFMAFKQVLERRPR